MSDEKDPKIAKGRFGKLFDRSKQLAGSIIGEENMARVGETTNSIMGSVTDGLKNVGSGTIEGTVKRFNEAMPYIERGGFHIVEVELNLGVNPSIQPHLVPVRRLSEDEKITLLDEVRAEDKQLTLTILQSLYRALQVADVAKFDGFDFLRMEIEVCLLPAVKLVYSRRDGANIDPTTLKLE